MSQLLAAISRYPILETVTAYLSSPDLLHLGLACHAFYDLIFASSKILLGLRRNTLCSGYGLHVRQQLASPYASFNTCLNLDRPDKFVWDEEEIEVRLYNTKCDAAGALPCVRCNVNICDVRQYLL